MDFKLKEYRILKLKKYFKDNSFFFFFNSTKISVKLWFEVEQNLKKLRLKYYKILNGTTLKTLKHSIYKNFNNIICGVILFLRLNFKNTEFKLNIIGKNLKSIFSLISVKLNNKVYSITQLSNFREFSYKKNVIQLLGFMKKALKTSYTLTLSKSNINSK